MYLKRLEVQGFKTFAKKTVLEFLPPKNNINPLTVIVGPNGSGKSNLADAIRWCLGEQSMKHLRGKKVEDVIFSGSEGRGRSGFAEVSMLFENNDGVLKAEYSEVMITRRLYRDGESDYLLNGHSVRLSDIQLLLAEAGVGQRTYAVIGQGMIDHVLTSSPHERKVFFDDATGVRGLQIRRHQSLLKLEKSVVNLQEVQMLLNELEPRLRLLRRQVSRLKEREAVQSDLKIAAKNYYTSAWRDLLQEKRLIESRIAEADDKLTVKKQELALCDSELSKMEQLSGGRDDGGSLMSDLQAAYKAAQAVLAEARRSEVLAERDIELAKVRAQAAWSPLPLTDIVEEIKVLAVKHEDLLKKLKVINSLEQVRSLESEVEQLFLRSTKFRDRLVRPSQADFKPDQAALLRLKIAKDNILSAEVKVREAEKMMDSQAHESTAQKAEFFSFQRKIRSLQSDVMVLEQARNIIDIDIARVDTKLDNLSSEMLQIIDRETADFLKNETRADSLLVGDKGRTAEQYDLMMGLRRKLELIGGIDEQAIKEHSQVEERFTFLSAQVGDLEQAIKSTEKIVDELDGQINEQSAAAFKIINEEFKKYFKVLFGGGSCSLMKLSEDEMIEDNKVTLDRAMDEVAEEVNRTDVVSDLNDRVVNRKEAVAGIDIQATPPGKKLKSLNLLSGGERALTSIALLCAIMATNPSPFVVLDEVDAALDEANTVRFARILNELRQHTQFIVVSHNRATMAEADTLYGVTMGNDGVSSLLSVKIDEVGVGETARR